MKQEMVEFQFIFISAHEGKYGITMSEVKCEVDMLVSNILNT